MIQRLLCRLGVHDWRMVREDPPRTRTWLHRCARCGATCWSGLFVGKQRCP